MFDFFEIKTGETCLVYELLGVSIIDILNFYDDMIPLHIVKKIARDVLLTLNSFFRNTNYSYRFETREHID